MKFITECQHGLLLIKTEKAEDLKKELFGNYKAFGTSIWIPLLLDLTTDKLRASYRINLKK
jgi:hypothetical protein